LGELSYPYDVAVDAHGYQFVCEFGNSRIQVFDPDCEPVEIIGGPGSEPGQFANPWAVALDSQGNLVVADGLNHRVQKLVRKMGPIGPMRRMEAAVAKGDSRITHHASR
jgi:DNA-binding beta-propeller fold protein YncE